MGIKRIGGLHTAYSDVYLRAYSAVYLRLNLFVSPSISIYIYAHVYIYVYTIMYIIHIQSIFLSIVFDPKQHIVHSTLNIRFGNIFG